MIQTAEAVSPQQVFSDPALFAATFLKILNKDKQLVPLRYNSAQRHFLANRTGRDLILKARQLGFSSLVQAELFRAATTSASSTLTLTHLDDTTQAFRRMADRFYENLPTDFRPVRKYANATVTTYLDFGGESIIATAGSTNSARGLTISHAHLSEVAFWRDAELVMASVLQSVPESGSIAIESTANGASGYFYERCMEALDGDSAFKLWFYPWWFEPHYTMPLTTGETLDLSDEEQALISAHNLTFGQIKWRRRKQKELGLRLFQQEFAENPRTCFLVSGVGYFSDIPHLDAVFSAPTDASYDPTHTYVSAADFGQQQDFSAQSVIDVTTLQEVDLWRLNRVPWGDIRARMRQTCQKWHCATFHPEANSMGGTNIEELHKEFAAAGCKTRIVPFETTAQSKPPMVQALHWALDQGGLKLLNDPAGKQELYGYVASQTPSGAWKYEGLPHDDTVVARFGAWYGIVDTGGRMTIGTAPESFSNYRG